MNDTFTGLSFDSAGRLLVANSGRKTSIANLGNSSILREKASGQCATTRAGCFDTFLSGGTGSLLKNPRDVAEGKDGALYVTNAGPSETGKSDNKILKIVIRGTTGTATAQDCEGGALAVTYSDLEIGVGLSPGESIIQRTWTSAPDVMGNTGSCKKRALRLHTKAILQPYPVSPIYLSHPPIPVPGSAGH